MWKYEDQNRRSETIWSIYRGLPRKDNLGEYPGGYVLGQLGRFPETGEAVNLGKYKLEIAKMDDRRIDQLRLTPLPKNVHEETS